MRDFLKDAQKIGKQLKTLEKSQNLVKKVCELSNEIYWYATEHKMTYSQLLKCLGAVEKIFEQNAKMLMFEEE